MLFPRRYIPDSDQFFDEIVDLFLVIRQKFSRSTAFDMMFEKFIVRAFE